MNSVVGDLQGNVRRILEFTDQARAVGADVVAFPEMVVTGYPAEDLLFRHAFLLDNLEAVYQAVDETHGITAVIGYAHPIGGRVYNAAAIGAEGRLAGMYRKHHLPTYGVFDEDRYFYSGVSFPVFRIGGVRVGVNICEDIWFADGPTARQCSAGAEVIINISASPYHLDKQRVREDIVRSTAKDNSVHVAYVNAVGGQDELVFDGASLVFDPSGNLIARAREFEEDLLIVDIRLPHEQPLSPVDLRDPSASSVIHVSGAYAGDRPPLDETTIAPVLKGPSEVYNALVVGTRDYVIKNGFSKVLVGLSGGIDSALTACVGADALGPENVKVVAMPSRFSSEGSLLDAAALADNLGLEMLTIPIEEGHQAMLNMLSDPFRGTQSGIAEENVQARLRGNLLMALSNKFGWLVLTTGNKSEMAMGYATLYGDMAGGFAVLKDVPKTLVYELCRWRNENGFPIDVIPREIIEKPPSAELRPDQKDEDSLPPYEVLDGVLQAYVEEDKSYADILSLGYDSDTVRQVMTAVDRNEYKRRQSPPGVKITAKAFGKDRRLPIVNGYRQF
jgi:NAD+ synthase (glutamine-hydrolysing)